MQLFRFRLFLSQIFKKNPENLKSNKIEILIEV